MPFRKCLILSTNRNLGKLHRGKYEGLTGYYMKRIFFKGDKFAIPKNVKPVDLDISKPFRRNRKIPVFAVDELSHTAYDMTQTVKLNDNLIAKLIAILKLFSEAKFYETMATRLKLTIGETLIYLGCGLGLGLLIDRILMIVFK